jgi:hypothetical protein
VDVEREASANKVSLAEIQGRVAAIGKMRIDNGNEGKD